MRDRSQPLPTASDTEAIYATHFDYVWTNLRRLGVPPAQLEDACHDVFLVAHRRAADYDQRCAIKTWLFGILRRVASDYRRRSKREQQRREQLALAEPRPSHPADTWSRRVWMLDFLRGLRPDQREAYVMLELEQMTAREASVVCGVNANTLSARLRAARLRLRDSLAAEQAPMTPAALVRHERRPEPAPAPARQRVLAGLLPLWSSALPGGTAAAGAGSSSAASTASGSPASGPASGSAAANGASGSAASTAPGSTVVGLKVWFAASALVLTTLAVDPSRAAGPSDEVGDPAPPTLATLEPRAPRIPDPPPPPEPAPVEPEPPPPTPEPPATPASDPEPRRTVPPAPAEDPPPSRAPARKRPREPKPTPAPESGDLTAQTELAGRVFAASDPQQVLQLVEQYRERFGRGFFGDRLAVHEIAALCALGRTSQARRSLDRLRRRSTPLFEQARRRCGFSNEANTKAKSSRHQGG